jgi:hypothetical protein
MRNLGHSHAISHNTTHLAGNLKGETFHFGFLGALGIYQNSRVNCWSQTGGLKGSGRSIEDQGLSLIAIVVREEKGSPFSEKVLNEKSSIPFVLSLPAGALFVPKAPPSVSYYLRLREIRTLGAGGPLVSHQRREREGPFGFPPIHILTHLSCQPCRMGTMQP